MKKGAILFSLFVISLNIVSAATFSLSEVMDSFDTETIFLLVLFLIFFAVLNFSLSKAFKNNKTVANVVALGLSLLIIYGINKWGIDVEGFIYSIGAPEDIMSIVWPLLFIAGFIFMLAKIKTRILLAIGTLFILIDVFGFTEREGVLLVLGIGLIILYLIWQFLKWFIGRRNRNPYTGGQPLPPTPPGSSDEYNRHMRELAEERQRRELAERDKQKSEEMAKREQQKKWEAFNRARKIGIENVQNKIREFENYDSTTIQNEINTAHAILRESGGKALPPKRPNESDYNYKIRYERAKEGHAMLVRAHERRKEVRKQIDEMTKRIDHLRKQSS